MINASHKPVTIFISAAPYLMAEREALARMIAELPVSLAWRIGQTPAEAEPVDASTLQQADLYFVVMGADIRAPVGLELHLARQAGLGMIAFLKQGVIQTPAGQAFSRQVQLNWRPFKDAADLSRQVQQVTVEYLLRRAVDYALTPAEVAALQKLRATPEPKESPSGGEGTGHSAVMLSRERYLPGQGVLIGPSDS